MNNFYEYMNHFIDFGEIQALFILVIIFFASYGISKVIMYFADKYYKEVIEKTFEKEKQGESLTDRERKIIEKYKIL